MNNELISIILVVIATLGFLFILLPYLKDKKLINSTTIDMAIKAMEMIGAVVSEIKPQDTLVDQVTKVCKVAVHSAEQVYMAGDNESKKVYAVNMAQKILTEMGIELNDNRQQIIIATIESLVFLLPPSHKK